MLALSSTLLPGINILHHACYMRGQSPLGHVLFAALAGCRLVEPSIPTERFMLNILIYLLILSLNQILILQNYAEVMYTNTRVGRGQRDLWEFRPSATLDPMDRAGWKPRRIG